MAGGRTCGNGVAASLRTLFQRRCKPACPFRPKEGIANPLALDVSSKNDGVPHLASAGRLARTGDPLHREMDI